MIRINTYGKLLSVVCSIYTIPLYAYPTEGELTQRFSQESKHTFQIVSEETCTRSSNGTLLSCRFPEIKITETLSSLPPLPFETTVTVRPSYSCNLEGFQGSLRIRLAELAEDETGEKRFLRYEDLSIHHTHSVQFRDPEGLGQIKIYPRSERIFSSIQFQPGCEISLEIAFNQVAVYSDDEANRVLSTLNDKIEMTQRAKDALSLIIASDLDHMRVTQLRALTERSQSSLEDLRDELEVIFELSESCESIFQTDSPLRSSLRRQGSNLEGIQQLLQGMQENIQRQTPEVLEGLQAKAREYQTQLRQFEQELDQARQVLSLINFSARRATWFRDEFERILEQEISGPHGVLDEFKRILGQTE